MTPSPDDSPAQLSQDDLATAMAVARRQHDPEVTPLRRFPGGLRAQLLIPAVGLISLTLSMVVLGVVQLESRQLRRAETARARSHAEALTHTLSSIDDASTTTWLNTHLRHADLSLIAWHREGQWHVVSLIPHSTDTLLAPHLSRAPHTAQHTVEDRTYVFVSAHPRAQDQSVVVVAQDLTNAQRQLESMTDLLVIYIFGHAILLLILGYALFTFWVTRPLKALGIATERATQGDLASPISLTPSNEFGTLARRFNTMLARLESQRQQLQAQVAELQHTNDELQHTQATLLRSEKLASVGQLAAGVAHEIGNPLTIISSYSELMSDTSASHEERAQWGKRIHKQIERIQVIIRELLDFSRDDSQVPTEPIALAAPLQEAIHLARTTKRTQHLDIQLHLPGELPAVMAVHSQVIQVMLNLMFNAADALQDTPEATLHITALERQPGGDPLRVLVCDNGPGIDAAHVAKLFNPFFTTKAPGEGTGLGLAIALRIMQDFGGDLRYTPAHPDAPLPGACFELLWTLAPS